MQSGVHFQMMKVNKARTGAGTSLTMHDMGLSTVIGAANKDATGKPLSAGVKSSIERLRTWDSRSQAHSSADRNLRQALNEMDKLKDKLALTNAVIEKAAYIYRKAMERKLVRGRSIQGLVAACLYAACRNTETPRTLDDIANGINIRRKDVARCYRLIFRELELKMPVVDPVKGVSRIASIAGLGEKSKRKAISILNEAKRRHSCRKRSYGNSSCCTLSCMYQYRRSKITKRYLNCIWSY